MNSWYRRSVEAVNVEAEAEYGAQGRMIGGLEVEDIWKDFCFVQATKEKCESGKASVLVLIRAGTKVIENKGNFSNRTNSNAIDSQKEGPRQVFVIKMFVGIGARDKADHT